MCTTSNKSRRTKSTKKLFSALTLSLYLYSTRVCILCIFCTLCSVQTLNSVFTFTHSLTIRTGNSNRCWLLVVVDACCVAVAVAVAVAACALHQASSASASSKFTRVISIDLLRHSHSRARPTTGGATGPIAAEPTPSAIDV